MVTGGDHGAVEAVLGDRRLGRRDGGDDRGCRSRTPTRGAGAGHRRGHRGRARGHQRLRRLLSGCRDAGRPSDQPRREPPRSPGPPGLPPVDGHGRHQGEVLEGGEVADPFGELQHLPEHHHHDAEQQRQPGGGCRARRHPVEQHGQARQHQHAGQQGRGGPRERPDLALVSGHECVAEAHAEPAEQENPEPGAAERDHQMAEEPAGSGEGGGQQRLHRPSFSSARALSAEEIVNPTVIRASISAELP